MAGEAVAHAAEAAAHGGVDLVQVVALLAAGRHRGAVVPAAGAGLGARLSRGRASPIGPFGLGLVGDPQAVLHAAELGVVLFLFIVGLEMEPAKLWGLRKQIFELGVLQVGDLRPRCSTAVGIWLLGLPPAVAFVAGMGFVLTSTAIVMQILSERGELQTPARAEDRLDAAARGSRHRAAAGGGGAAGRRASIPTQSMTQRWISIGVAGGLDRRGDLCRPLGAEPGVPDPRRDPRLAR